MKMPKTEQKKYVLAIDQGTTSTRAMIFYRDGKILYKSQQEVQCFFPHDGWVEQNAIDVWLSVLDVINDCLAKTNLTYENIDCIGLTNQRETTIVWDKKTGMPVYNAVVWQSRQSLDICNSWSKYKELIHDKTGLILNPYFSASKIRFILDHIKDGQKRAEKGELLCGTIDTWVMYKLSKGKIFKTDITNASRTMCFNINTLKWDDELLKIYNIPKSMLAEVVPSSHYFGDADALVNGLKICGVAGDQQAALFGQNCFEPGESKNTYGTGCFMLMNIGDKPILSKNGLLTTIAWQIGDKVTYAFEGSIFIGGACVQWLRDQMRMIKHSSDSETYAKKVPNELGVYVVPAFVGLGAPYWDDECRGGVFGLTRATTKEHFIRATLNSIALQSKDLVVAMEKECGKKLKTLKVDGGATTNGYLMQYQADILHCKVMLPNCLETTALGAAYLAGLENKYWNSIDDIRKIHKYKKEYLPKMSKEEIVVIDKKWAKAIEAVRVFK